MRRLEELEAQLLEIAKCSREDFVEHAETHREALQEKMQGDYLPVAVEALISLEKSGIISSDASDEERIAILIYDYVNYVLDDYPNILENAGDTKM